MTVIYCPECRFGCAWLYYGVVLLTTSLLQNDPHCGKFLHMLRTVYSAKRQPKMLAELRLIFTLEFSVTQMALLYCLCELYSASFAKCV